MPKRRWRTVRQQAAAYRLALNRKLGPNPDRESARDFLLFELDDHLTMVGLLFFSPLWALRMANVVESAVRYSIKHDREFEREVKGKASEWLEMIKAEEIVALEFDKEEIIDITESTKRIKTALRRITIKGLESS